MKPFMKNHFKREVIAMILVFVLPVLLGLLVAFVAPNLLRDIGRSHTKTGLIPSSNAFT
jgi:hypothetical protein